ncbi:hypothetical protein [Salibacterium aidingense]|uniref:hypothetical protein n=1 Tax=Salibacterium aidingense TaxID=384933 RepID=UPI0004163176|nr:hypothetical protein [Salibacterium aidingense]
MIINVLLLLALLFLSFSGYAISVYVKYRIAPAVLPLFLFTSTILVLFLGGLLNVLAETVYVLFAGGLLLFVYSVSQYTQKKWQASALLSPGLIFFIAASVFFTVLLKEAVFLHYDNFSHWGLIVKELVQSNSLPDESSIITYTTYPPGAALFVYYIVSITGFSESMALIAQGIFIAGALAPLFIFCSWKKPVHAAAFLFIPAVLLLVNSTSIYTLLVDPLLGYISAAVFVTAWYYRDNWGQMAFLLLPILSTLVLLKDSGKIFLAFSILWIIGLFFRYLRKDHSWTEKLASAGRAGICTLLVPLFVNLLWSRYIAKAYTSEYEDSKFAITRDTLTDINKSPEFIENLLPMIFHASFDLSSPLFQGIIWIDIFAILTITAVRSFSKQWPASLLSAAVFMNIFYFLYTGLLYLLYLYLMPEVEAEYLAGFDRYQSSAVIFFLGVVMVFLLKEWMENEHPALSRVLKKAAPVLIGISVLLPFAGGAQGFFNQENTAASSRPPAASMLTELRQQENISGNTRLTLIHAIGESDRGFLRHVMRYERMTANTYIHTMCTSEEEEQTLREDLNRSGYLMVLEMTPEMQSCLDPQSNINTIEPGLYHIRDGVITSPIDESFSNNDR